MKSAYDSILELMSSVQIDLDMAKRDEERIYAESKFGQTRERVRSFRALTRVIELEKKMEDLQANLSKVPKPGPVVSHTNTTHAEPAKA